MKTDTVITIPAGCTGWRDFAYDLVEDARLNQIARRVEIDHRRTKRRRTRLRKKQRLARALACARVAMTEAVALEEIASYLDQLLPDDRYVGQRVKAT